MLKGIQNLRYDAGKCMGMKEQIPRLELANFKRCCINIASNNMRQNTNIGLGYA